MERAKSIMQRIGPRKGLKELLSLPEESKSEVAESFGDLLLRQKKIDYAVAAFYIAGNSQKIMQVGDTLYNMLELNRKNDYLAKLPRSLSPRVNLPIFRASCSIESASHIIKGLAAYLLAKELGAPTQEKFEKLKNEYAMSFDVAQRYAAACEELKSGDSRSFEYILQMI